MKGRILLPGLSPLTRRKPLITHEHMRRAEREFIGEQLATFQKARCLEKSLEAYTYGPSRTYNPVHREKLLEDFRDADYMAESRAWILGLIRKGIQDATE